MAKNWDSLITALTLTRSDPTKNLHRDYRLDVQLTCLGLVLHPRVGPHLASATDKAAPSPTLPPPKRRPRSTGSAAGRNAEVTPRLAGRPVADVTPINCDARSCSRKASHGCVSGLLNGSVAVKTRGRGDTPRISQVSLGQGHGRGMTQTQAAARIATIPSRGAPLRR
jgi:hypothetical protein